MIKEQAIKVKTIEFSTKTKLEINTLQTEMKPARQQQKNQATIFVYI